jgi:hypothetical protein
MKFLPLFCLATFTFLPCAGADLTVVQSIESKDKDNKTATNKVTIEIKGERARIQANPKYAMIVDTKTGEVIALVPEDKAFQRLSAEQARNLGDRFRVLAKDIETSLEIATPKPTGKKEKINGYEAEEYIADTPKYKAAYWVAKDYPDYQSILRQMKLLKSNAFTAVRKPMPDYYDFPGLPIRTKIKFQGQEEATTTISFISQDSVPDSEFGVPPDYAEVHLPDMEIHSKAPWAPLAAPTEKPEGR